MYADHNKDTSALGVSATRVIYTTDKSSEAELIAQITTDAGEVRKLCIARPAFAGRVFLLLQKLTSFCHQNFANLL